jgi:hypothetical protein
MLASLVPLKLPLEPGFQDQVGAQVVSLERTFAVAESFGVSDYTLGLDDAKFIQTREPSQLPECGPRFGAHFLL